MPGDRDEQLEEFRRLIAAGCIRAGMSRTEARAALGEPDQVGGTSRRYPTPSIFKYGDVELCFGPRASDGLTLVYSEREGGGDPITLPLPDV